MVNEKCGIFGVYGKGLHASRLAFFGLFALQHRGQEGSGICSTLGKELFIHKERGLVSQVFNEEIIESLSGHAAIGHNRYSTSGSKDLDCTQPILVNNSTIALVHNGNLPSVTLLENFLKERSISTQGMSDSVMIAEAIGSLVGEGAEIEEAISQIFSLITGAFSILVMTKDKIIAFRDHCGIRPLVVGSLNGGYVFSSETCALLPIGAKFLRDVLPGEMVVVDEGGIRSKQLAKGTPKLDIFEFVYFSRPDSHLLGKSVYSVRKNFGIELAKEYLLEADVVIPIPETAIPVAIGYSEKSGIPMEMGIVKNRYIHRTFIEPEQHIREQGVKVKLAPLKEVIDGKKVIVIDDSIVRGTTSKQIVEMLFGAGAKEVHFLISSPPVKFPDFYGIDTPDQKELLASHKSVSEMNTYLGATSLNFLSLEGMIKATSLPESSFCTSCFTGKYPIDIKERGKELDLD
ncbi:MAG: amidophosphoribosyltransferase [Candidatus Harrisonbacteria bacterium CG10_big_fil_rev_8_21_14_0_10_44_23]|uniref:Amidophosphoribosyltransferase n=1 Tax=Candidatus Harrisonbacteria bacterium CG10_big_fil_rev_8_21_14_0_10_44_23 TaxID=1974585 RepID=A0A2H0UQK8_9BACT|nr:MAG: amidophosphoribosyltransferase [Candidatus Harrisonbacteria bacterium CG10_big_fil_rev_8_21_14_0_10_44_23]